MEGERKKRKMETEEEDEEEKIEKFFALVRSTREMRKLLRGNLNGAKEKKDQKKAEEEEQKTAGAWNPAFQPEDFVEDHESDVHRGAGPSKAEDEDETDDKGTNGLNLKLSL